MQTHEIANYIAELDRLYQTGDATEVTNEPRRIECGAPDYITTRNEIPVGYIEAKDAGADLNDKARKAQFDRYNAAQGNPPYRWRQLK